ncbi:hypothetical protein R4144_22185 [Gordonia amicalis]|uniref:hypothetical protein n=1 Tax=Gordonia amicalis TaxID=89053 RepID=UPI002952B445|nr:hypothetical protein [Gordonia amicalis]MDV7176008.1 hypothetical protein [Gordonia amicalis]
MVRGYEALMQSDEAVDLGTAMTAATRLQTVLDRRAATGSQSNVADAMVKLDRIIDAVKTTVPEEMWPLILDRINDDSP